MLLSCFQSDILIFQELKKNFNVGRIKIKADFKNFSSRNSGIFVSVWWLIDLIRLSKHIILGCKEQ